MRWKEGPGRYVNPVYARYGQACMVIRALRMAPTKYCRLGSLAYNVYKFCIFSAFLVTFWQRPSWQVPLYLQKVVKLFPIHNIVTPSLLEKPHTGVRV